MRFAHLRLALPVVALTVAALPPAGAQTLGEMPKGSIQTYMQTDRRTYGFADNIRLYWSASNQTTKTITIMPDLESGRGEPRLAPGATLRIDRLSGPKGEQSRVEIVIPPSDQLATSRPVAAHSGLSANWTTSASRWLADEGAYRFVLANHGKETASPLFYFTPSGDPPAWLTVSYTTDKPSYFIGEPIEVKFSVSNGGDVPFPLEQGGDYRGASRHQRFAFRATDAQGRAVSDPHPWESNMGGLGMAQSVLVPGDSYTDTIDLRSYLDFSKPGSYQVEAFQDFGWGRPVGGLESAGGYPYARGGSFAIEMREPTREEVSSVIEGALAVRDPTMRSLALRELRAPLYLAPLLARLRQGPGLMTRFKTALGLADGSEPQPLDPYSLECLVNGVASVDTPEATGALIELTADSRPPVQQAAFAALAFWRLPDPWVVGSKARGAKNPPDPHLLDDQQGPRLKIQARWDQALRPLALDAIRRGLKSPDAKVRGAAIQCASSIADPALLPDLVNAAEAAGPSGAIEGALRRLKMMGATLPPDMPTDTPSAKRVRAAMLDYGTSGTLSAADEAFELDLLKSSDAPLRQAGVEVLNRCQSFARADEIPWKSLLLNGNDSEIFLVTEAIKRILPSQSRGIVDAALNAATPEQRKRLENYVER